MPDDWKYYTLNKGKTFTRKILGNTSQFFNSSSTTGMWKVTQEKLITKLKQNQKKPKISTFFQKQPIEERFRFNVIVNFLFFECTIFEKGYDLKNITF